ncbi:MAG: NADH:ubiquinone reductase (Na(+)-transporting) subunit A, partial [Saprospiraceae bacterium]|nr:NADH:ubiquinone reductase (Na(+)-transporting) subunit A [Saprospiraceae bacterium]
PGQEASSEELIEFLIGTGVWPHINQRPFDIVPDPKVVPENIFISSFNTAPMAVNTNLMVEGNGTFFQKGLDTLCKLTSGKVYLGLDGRKTKTPHPVFANAENVEKHYFDGKHPSGNVGVQIHHTNPIKKNTSVWTLDVETVIALGKLMEKGIYDFRRMVALTGTQFKENHIYNSFEGSSIVELTEGKLIHDKSSTRLVSGNILSGKHISVDDFMSKGHNQLTSIKEGDYNELFGWLLPIKPRPSLSKTFPSFLMGNYKFEADTNTHGERRAFVVTGQYEKVLPMDILPQHLMKSIMVGDIERMEGLGINELTEEDVALCEFTCTSKMPLQKILREGLDMMREQA